MTDSSTLDFRPGSTVRFVCDIDQVTGSNLITLMTGVVSDRPVFPCAHRVIVPVLVDTVSGRRVVWVSDDQVLSCSPHPSGGLP